jgi:D-glycero-beta-D-manno-heptose-7-phosphate kinase
MKILVIGDSCKDIYRYGECVKLDQEAPVPVFNEVNEVEYEGMSLNVANNVSSFGVNCEIITNKKTIYKIRYVDTRSNQLVMRVDQNDGVERIQKIQSINYKKYNAVIVSDYNKGFLTQSDLEYISNEAKLSFLQTSKVLAGWCKQFDYIKINNYEYTNTLQFANREFLDELNLIVTKGEQGVVYKEKKFPILNPVRIRSLAGAGDTFLAALAVNYLKNKNISKSIHFAQNASKKAVSELGITVVGDKSKRKPKIIKI